jgi:hypothetical protein
MSLADGSGLPKHSWYVTLVFIIMWLTLFLATSVDVERVFSRGRLFLPYVRNRLSAQSTRAQLCVGNWSLRGYIHDSDVLVASRLPDVEGDAEVELEEGWDKIVL